MSTHFGSQEADTGPKSHGQLHDPETVWFQNLLFDRVQCKLGQGAKHMHMMQSHCLAS